MFCGYCGTKIEKNVKFCAECGKSTELSDPQPSKQENTVGTPSTPHDSGTGLIDSSSKPGQIIHIRCDNCNYTGKPYKWSFRTWVGVLYLFTLLNIIGILIYFVSTNAYICQNCGERDKLVQILNDRRHVPIKSLKKNTFQAIATFFLIVGVLISILRYSVINQ